MELALKLALGLALLVALAAGLLAVLGADFVAGLIVLVAGLAAGLDADLGAGLEADLGADFDAVLGAVLAPAFAVGLVPDVAGALRVGFKASEPIGPTGTESRRVGVRPALTLAFFLATGLRTGSAGLGAPSFKRTGLSPQISSRL